MPGSKVTVEASFKLIETEPENPFTDISKNDYFYDAVLWAVEQGITSGTSGTSATTFSPNVSCTRAQIVTFIYRNAQQFQRRRDPKRRAERHSCSALLYYKGNIVQYAFFRTQEPSLAEPC